MNWPEREIPKVVQAPEAPQLRISLAINPFGVAGSFRGSAASSLYSDYMAVDS